MGNNNFGGWGSEWLDYEEDYRRDVADEVREDPDAGLPNRDYRRGPLTEALERAIANLGR